ncbi:MAG: alpha/beta hydrolase [Methanomicrobiaceae archaeon]|nr:alpha/beta hydrolase [Methanomicrobiaceae archaeon]
MGIYILVHGGHNDGSVWQDVIPFLESAGHKVFAPTLAEPEETSLDCHISEVCGLIEGIRSGERVLLAGHSYAAMVITGAASRIPERIKRLFYLDSAFPKNGESLYDVMGRCGYSYRKFGLSPAGPFIDPLSYDEELIRLIPKVYVHCTKSEFLAVGECIYKELKKNAARDNWTFFELESSHHCMQEMPEETAGILLAGEVRESSKPDPVD